MDLNKYKINPAKAATTKSPEQALCMINIVDTKVKIPPIKRISSNPIFDLYFSMVLIDQVYIDWSGFIV